MLHAFFGRHGITTRDHLDEAMPLLLVDDTRLNHTKLREDGTQIFVVTSATVWHVSIVIQP
jgi:hypothetical protein